MWLQWVLVAVAIIGILIIIFLPIKPANKVSVSVTLISVLVAAYTLLVDIQARNRQQEIAQIQRDKEYWTEIHRLFLNHPKLDQLYRNIYGGYSDEFQTNTYAALSILAQAVDNLVSIEGAPTTITEIEINDISWLQRITSWVDTNEFRDYWERNYTFYSSATNRVVEGIYRVLDARRTG